MADPSTSRLGGLDDETREVICTVVCDGRSWKARGTWIDRAQGPVVVLQLQPTAATVVVDHEPVRPESDRSGRRTH